MSHAVYPDFNTAYHAILKDLIENGEGVAPRGCPCLEIINYGFTIEDASNVQLTYSGLQERQAVYERYKKEEIEWYLSGDLMAGSAPSKFWLKLADENGMITSNYGSIVLYDYKIPYGSKAVTSYEYVVNELKKDRDSRQAIAHYGEPHHFREGNKDKPCTITQQFLIRDDKLHCITTMRSNDVWMGLPYDVSWFCFFMAMVAAQLGVSLGSYHHNVGSMHLYEKNLESAKKEILRQN